MKVTSPITNGRVKFLKSYDTQWLIDKYQKDYSIDVSIFFKGIKDISVFECEDTAYRFYFPFNISGDGDFYKSLQKIDWYYKESKWEYKIAQRCIRNKETLLEIGCGNGHFISRVVKKYPGISIQGIELNEHAVAQAKAKGLNVSLDDVKDHAGLNEGKYDAVFAFQVLEHISEVHGFLKSSIACLKENGKLIISVPNNGSFIKFENGGTLNYPPHHMGLWDKKSLTELGEYFNLEIQKVAYEPLQLNNLDWYRYYLESIIKKSKIARYFFYKFRINKILNPIIRVFRFFIKGHTIIVVYRKIR